MYVSLPPYKPQENHKKNNHENHVPYISSGICQVILHMKLSVGVIDVCILNYLLSHWFETIRISGKTHQIKTTLFQFF